MIAYDIVLNYHQLTSLKSVIESNEFWYKQMYQSSLTGDYETMKIIDLHILNIHKTFKPINVK